MQQKSKASDKISKEVSGAFLSNPKLETLRVTINLKSSYAKEGTKWIRETFCREGISIDSENTTNHSLIAIIQKKHVDRLSFSIFVSSVELVKG